MFRRLLPVCAAAVLVACGGGTDASPTTPPVDAPSAGATTPDVAVPAALQFSAPLVGGGDIELAALAGRPVLLWFWAPW